MVIKNLFRRKGRTFLTIAGIAIGIAAIIALGAMAQGLKTGFVAMTQGSQADVILSKTDAFTALMSTIDENVVPQILSLPEVADIDSMLFTNAILDNNSMIFVFGYEPNGFAIEHFRLVEGQPLADVRSVRGKPMLIGHQVADSMGAEIGDTFIITGSAFRIVGIFETGNGFEDSAIVVPLKEVQILTLQPHIVSQMFVKLNSPNEIEQFRNRIERRFPDLKISTTDSFIEQEQALNILDAGSMVIASLAVVVGGIITTNTLFMSVFERTREIGILRALGWRQRQILFMILGESLTLSLLGGLVGSGFGVLGVIMISRSDSLLRIFGMQITPDLFVRGFITVILLGIIGGCYPAWWASRLTPTDAFLYEGGGKASKSVPQTPGMATRNLLRRKTRTTLTLLSITVSIGAIVIMGGVATGMITDFTEVLTGSHTDLFAAEAGIDIDTSAIDEHAISQISKHPAVEAVSGIFFTGTSTDDVPMLLIFGYNPRELAIQGVNVIDGHTLEAPHQVLVGSALADQLGLHVGENFRVLDSNFRIVGIFENGIAFQDAGIVLGVRDVQKLMGKPRQVQACYIKLHNPEQAETAKAELNALFPEIDFSLTSELGEALSDFRVMQELVAQISFLAMLVGSLGMLNTMLMSVLERTQEIGILRSIGWNRRRVLFMILNESLVLGIIGGVLGILLGFGLGGLLDAAKVIGGAIRAAYPIELLIQAEVIAIVAGVIGGIYPAWRATRMSPVEALRYE